jgi:hypothetical protein
MFDIEVTKERRVGSRITTNCPYCNKKYEKYRQDNSRYIVVGKSQLINKQCKTRMSKKERLKRRGLIKNGI